MVKVGEYDEARILMRLIRDPELVLTGREYYDAQRLGLIDRPSSSR